MKFGFDTMLNISIDIPCSICYNKFGSGSIKYRIQKYKGYVVQPNGLQPHRKI